MPAKSVSYAKAKRYIENLDLTIIIKQLTYDSKKTGWTRRDAKIGVRLYKNYLLLLKKYGAKYILPPSLEIDDLWHQHILNTKRYHKDCQAIFGKYLHHNPADLAKEKKLYDKYFEKTQELYYKMFGEYL
jgi:hypothetical protein